MKIIFDKLWDKINSQGLRRSELFRELGMSSQTLNQMRHNQNVSLQTIDKLCEKLNCQPDEIMELVND